MLPHPRPCSQLSGPFLIELEDMSWERKARRAETSDRVREVVMNVGKFQRPAAKIANNSVGAGESRKRRRERRAPPLAFRR